MALNVQSARFSIILSVHSHPQLQNDAMPTLEDRILQTWLRRHYLYRNYARSLPTLSLVPLAVICVK